MPGRRGRAVWDELADELHAQMAHAAANQPRPERWKVTALAPLTVEQLQGELVLRIGDPDLEVTQSVRDYDERFGLVVGDVVVVHVIDHEYSVCDVVSATSVAG